MQPSPMACNEMKINIDKRIEEELELKQRGKRFYSGRTLYRRELPMQ